MTKLATTLTLIGLGIGLAATPVRAVDSGTRYGKGVSLAKATPIAELVAHPADYLGKAVRVDGVVTGVCEKRGCWIQLTDPAASKGIRLKVEDGEIVFPMAAMGKKASAEGVLEAIHVTEAQAGAMAKEHAGEGAEGMPKAGTSYQIKGTGAVIY